jgi:hypothetical protein
MAFTNRTNILTPIAIILNMTKAKNRKRLIVLLNMFACAQRVMFVCLDANIAE